MTDDQDFDVIIKDRYNKVTALHLAVPLLPNMELKVIENNRYKRRNYHQKEKIVIKTSDDETVKILPSVLLTYNAKFIKIHENVGGKKKEPRSTHSVN